MSWLTDWIGGVLESILCAIIAGVIYALNFVIEALGLLVSGLLALLPGMPSLPAMPQEVTDVLGWVNWFFPVGATVAVLVFLLSAWVLWQAVVIGLRWARATSA